MKHLVTSLMLVCTVACTESSSPDARKPDAPTAAKGVAPTPATPKVAPAKGEAPAAKEASAVEFKWNLDEKGVVMHGFDPVSYRGEDGPKPGTDAHQTKWDGGTWKFASAENLAAFKASPEKYAPQVGGYCTFGVVIEKKLDGDPRVYHLDGEQLFLFLNTEVKGKFMLDVDGNQKSVASNWPSLKGSDPAKKN